MTNDPRTMPAALDRFARQFPDHDALITDDRSFTAAELRDEVHRAAAALIALGVERRPGGHLVAEHLALGGRLPGDPPRRRRHGAAEHPLHRRGGQRHPGPHRRAGAVRDGPIPGQRSRLPTWTATRCPRCGTSCGYRSTPTTAPGTSSSRAAPNRKPQPRSSPAPPPSTPDDVSDILFTSGTTGRSKGVLCAHRQSLSASASWAANGKITSDDRYLCINPFFHNFGYKAGILACLQTGATLIPHLTFDPLRALQAIEQHRITVLPGPPTIYQTLLDHPARGDYDLSSLRFAVTGAATVPVVLVERMQSELDIDIVLTAYGLTEANGMGTMCRADDDAVTVATTCGRPFADFELRIDSGEPGESGEVLLRGPNVMLGYLDDPEATAAAIDADGWLHTGDIGAVDKAGNLRITDRLKDMYICGGFNVYPAEIEQVLARMDGVADAAVIGVPDERLGEVGRAFVVTRPGAHLDEKSVIAYTREHLANFKAPRSVRFVDALPRNAGGKVVKPQLRELA